MFLKSPFLVFLTSLLFSSSSLVLLRFLGIDWDYHVDAVTYVETSSTVAMAIAEGGSPLNLGYFLIVDFLGSSPNLIILFNIFIFSLTNSFLCHFFRQLPFTSSSISLLSVVFFFSPYRVYLSTTLLKDTVVIFLLVLLYLPFLLSLRFKKFLSFSSLLSFLLIVIVRLQAVSYLLLSLRFKPSLKNNIYLFSATFFAFVLLQSYLQVTIWSVIQGASTVDMSFREYDSVPSFAALGFAGSFLRMLIWPFLVSTGFFIFFSPSLQFLFVALGSFLFFFSSFNLFRRYYITLYSYMLLALTASITTGFTSFVRYALPIQCISFLLVLSFRKRDLTQKAITSG